jgi:hypothetical protein
MLCGSVIYDHIHQDSDVTLPSLSYKLVKVRERSVLWIDVLVVLVQRI